MINIYYSLTRWIGMKDEVHRHHLSFLIHRLGYVVPLIFLISGMPIAINLIGGVWLSVSVYLDWVYCDLYKKLIEGSKDETH